MNKQLKFSFTATVHEQNYKLTICRTYTFWYSCSHV